MPPQPDGFHLLDTVSQIAPAEWDSLLEKTPGNSSPCLRHAYLSALESAGAVGARTGWIPCHATLWEHGQLIAALPLYQKHHSYGEYVFDWSWAQAYEQHGLAYYPKWLAAIPFTPIPGPRLLGGLESARAALLAHVLQLVESSGYSSFHLLFPSEGDRALLERAGLMMREGVQFHWENRGSGNPYLSFDDFLASLNHEKRKKIRQERRRAGALDLQTRWLDGHTASDADWQFFHRCYATTYALHCSTPYLPLAFFTRLARSSPDSVRLLIATREATPVASAFFLADSDALYGRYWGAVEHLPFLHFELCYYQAIEYCINQGLNRFEGGAQGEHKLSRGLLPVRTCSAHWIADPRFRNAVDDYLSRERNGIDFYLDDLSERTPFKQTIAERPAVVGHGAGSDTQLETDPP